MGGMEGAESAQANPAQTRGETRTAVREGEAAPHTTATSGAEPAAGQAPEPGSARAPEGSRDRTDTEPRPQGRASDGEPGGQDPGA
jgi:hypothetical protein